MNTVLTSLFRLSLEASALVLLVLLARKILGPRLSAGWRVALWALVALKLVCPAVLPTGFGIGTMSTVQDNAVVVAEPITVVLPSLVEAVQEPVVAASTSSLMPILFLVWLGGALTVMGMALWRHHRFTQSLRRCSRCSPASPEVRQAARQAGLGQAPAVRLSQQALVPSVTGFIQPTLVLPAQPVQQQVILHELFHIKHLDLPVNWAWLVLQALHWFNPLVWLAAACCQQDRELRCDESALACATNAERIAYGRELIRLQETFLAPPALAGVAACVRNHPPLRQRILMITQPVTQSPWARAALAVCLSIVTAFFFGAAQAEEGEKNRSREGERSEKPAAEGAAKTEEGGKRDGAAEGGKMREGDGKRGAREGEGDAKKGTREGEGGAKREGDRGKEKPGPRDGERSKTGMRDGEGEGKKGARDGEGKRGKEGEGSDMPGTGTSITVRVIDGGEQVQIGKEKMPMNKLRAYLSEFLPAHRGAKVAVQADDDVPFKTVSQVLDAVRDNGAKNASIQSTPADQ
jgi:beta-lactamase regulating signal transducer with metallopeptidase domain